MILDPSPLTVSAHSDEHGSVQELLNQMNQYPRLRMEGACNAQQ